MLELLLWIGIAVVIAVVEKISDGVYSHNFKKSGGFEAKCPHTFGEKK